MTGMRKLSIFQQAPRFLCGLVDYSGKEGLAGGAGEDKEEGTVQGEVHLVLRHTGTPIAMAVKAAAVTPSSSTATRAAWVA